MQEPSTGWDTVFTSHDMHEVASYYQVRVLQKKQLKLIHNLWYKMPYPIAGDIFASYTFKDRLECIPHGMIRTLEEYYHRPQWELYDLNSDTKELTSLIEEPAGSSGCCKGITSRAVGFVTDYQRPLDLLPRRGPGGTSLSLCRRWYVTWNT